ALALHVAPLLCFVRPSMRPGVGSSGREASAPFPQGAPGAAASYSLQTKKADLGGLGFASGIELAKRAVEPAAIELPVELANRSRCGRRRRQTRAPSSGDLIDDQDISRGSWCRECTS